MAAFGALAPFGLLEFGALPSDAEPIYASMIANVTGGFDVSVGSHTEATVYARAIAFASARRTIRHGFGQRRPSRVVEFLPALERQFGLAPVPSDTDEGRRRTVASRKLISRGPRHENLSNVLATLLGSDFLGVRVEPAGTTPGLFPASPGAVGAWDAPSSLPKFFRLLHGISVLGSPISFAYENLLGDGVRMGAGDILCVQPENLGLAEAVTIASAADTGDAVATATFTKSHDEGAIVRSHAPVWTSMRRSFTVVVTPTAAADAVIRGKIHALMRRIVRGTSIWAIAHESSAGTLGPFTVGSSRVGMVPIGTVTY